MEKISHAISNQKWAGVTLLVSDKKHFKSKAVSKRQRRKLYNDNNINSPRRYKNYKYMYTLNSSQIYETNIVGIEGKNREQHNNSRWFQYSTS